MTTRTGLPSHPVGSHNVPTTIYNATKKNQNNYSWGAQKAVPSQLSGAIPIQSAGTRITHSPVRDAHVPELAVGLYILGLLFIGDIVSTEYILLQGGHEINQYMIPFVEDPFLHIAIKLLVLCLVALVAVYANKRVPRAGSILVIAVILLYSVVVASNLATILRLFLGSPV